MTDKEISATAKVIITVEIDNTGGSWGKDCTVEQIHKQARQGAMNRLGQLIQRERGIRIVGEPRVLGITYELDR